MRATALSQDIGSRLIRGLHSACNAQTRKARLNTALMNASVEARDFAIEAAQDNAQRERYISLATTLEAQARSLRAEV